MYEKKIRVGVGMFDNAGRYTQMDVFRFPVVTPYSI